AVPEFRRTAAGRGRRRWRIDCAGEADQSSTRTMATAAAADDPVPQLPGNGSDVHRRSRFVPAPEETPQRCRRTDRPPHHAAPRPHPESRGDRTTLRPARCARTGLAHAARTPGVELSQEAQDDVAALRADPGEVSGLVTRVSGRFSSPTRCSTQT